MRTLLNLATQAKIISKLGMPGERQRETERETELSFRLASSLVCFPLDIK